MAIITCPECGAKNRVDEQRASRAQAVCGKCGAELPGPAAGGDSHPVVVTDQSFDQVIAQPGPVLVDFWAEWCGPCRSIAPALEQLAGESNGRYVIAKLNVDENPQTASQYQISGIPTMLIFKGGKVVDRIVGAYPKGAIAQRLQAQA